MARNKRAQTSRAGHGNRARVSDGRIWLYGRHAVEAALRNPLREIHRVLAISDDAADTQGHEPEIVARGEIDGLLPRDAVHQGIAALVAPLPAREPRDVCRPPGDAGALVLVLDRVSDPRNVGAILRSAAAFGAIAVIAPDRHAPPETGVLAKAASGALETVAMLRVTNLARTLDQLADLGYWRYALAARGGVPIAEAGFSGNVALVLGAEGQGLRRLTAAHCDGQVQIPIAADADSLNVSAAAAIALHAARSQLGWHTNP